MQKARLHLNGECGEGVKASRMIRSHYFQLIYYPGGNQVQLVEAEEDPDETRDLSTNPQYASQRQRMTQQLVAELFDSETPRR